MSAEHADRFFGPTAAEVVMTVEARWLERIRCTTIYRYSFDSAGFGPFDATAGYYVTERSVVPLEVTALDGLIDRILAAGIELRFAPSLNPLREALVASDYRGFGIHRYRE